MHVFLRATLSRCERLDEADCVACSAAGVICIAGGGWRQRCEHSVMPGKPSGKYSRQAPQNLKPKQPVDAIIELMRYP